MVSERNTKYLVVVSLDALYELDMKYAKDLPNFRFIIDRGSCCTQVKSIYPSLTYPCHASIITGTYPAKHGVYSNKLNQPGEETQDWHWFSRYMKVPTLCDIAKKAGMKVGSILWPVLAGAKIDYNCPEIMPTRKSQKQALLSLRYGTPFFILDLFIRFGSLLSGREQPNLDNFAVASAAHMIRTKRPNVSLLHLTELDSVRHGYGANSSQARMALARQDKRLGEIIQAVREAGMFDETTFIVLGDHGLIDFGKLVCPNVLLRQNGLITVDSTGSLVSWKAFSNTCGGSALVFMKNRDNETYDRLNRILAQLQNQPESGIEHVYTREEAQEKGLDGDFEFVLEASIGYSFANDWVGDCVRLVPEGSHVANHGYDPLKQEYKTVFMAYGPTIKPGVTIPSMKLVDIGPTMARILGLNMENCDGHVLANILVDEYNRER